MISSSSSNRIEKAGGNVTVSRRVNQANGTPRRQEKTGFIAKQSTCGQAWASRVAA